MSNQTKLDLNTLRDNDLITLMLYSLYKLSDDPNYAAISELMYVLDRKSFIKLCSVFGGCTIKIPTLQELEEITQAMLVYQEVNKGTTFSKACDKYKVHNIKKLHEVYDILIEAIKDINEK